MLHVASPNALLAVAGGPGPSGREPADAEYAGGGRLVRWPDWLLEGKPRPSPGRLAFATWKHFTKDSPLLPSGLLGPVTIRPD